MKSGFKIVTASVLLLAAASVALAQDTFPDTPANHWAYEALTEMKKEGLLVGYPDGLFRGSRPASRYEMAAAMHDVYTHLIDSINSTSERLKQLEGLNPQIDDLKSVIAQLQPQLDSMKEWGKDIAALQRASDTFEKELEQLGVNVEAMRHELGSLSERVTRLEKRKPPIDVHGDIDFWVGGAFSSSGLYGLSKDGRIEGTSSPGSTGLVNPPVSNPAGLTTDYTFLHEAAFTFSGTNEKGPQWTGTVVVSDAFGNFKGATPTVAFGNQSDLYNPATGMSTNPITGLVGMAEGVEDIYVQNVSARFGNKTADVEVGRVAYSVSPYLYQRIDNTSYYSNDRWDNGKYYFDGGIANLTFGPAKLDIFGGKNSGLLSAQGVDLDPVRSGPLDGPFGGGPHVASGVRIEADRSVGMNLQIATGKFGNLGLAYIDFDSDTDTPIDLGVNANRLAVYGTDGDFHLGPVELTGGYHKSELKDNNTVVNSRDNSSWNARLGYKAGSFRAYGEYRQVEGDYVAPGDWGRLGIIRNPTNIKGLRFGASVNILKSLTFSGTSEFDKGLSYDYASSTMLDPTTNIDSYQFLLDWKIKRDLSLFGSYEATRFGQLANPNGTFVGSGAPNYRWTGLGVGYGLNRTTKLTVQYEISDILNDYQVTNGSNFRGGLLTTQVTAKF